ncbi:MAG TPA: hypothetical protein VG870_02840 [Chitinophagaceae bacterium]|nr:hypothetical protein [Chitinophagaceae bacterium]
MKIRIISFLLAASMAFSSLYATAAPAETPSSIQKDFSRHFSHASELAWTQGNGFFRASFQLHGLYLFAYYSPDGRFIGVGRNLAVNQLPLLLQHALKEQYRDSWITDLREFSSGQGTTYYVTLENADRQTMLQGISDDWKLVKTIEK